MTQIRSILTRANALAAAGTLVFAAALTAIPAPVSALSLLDRSLMVSSTNASDDLEAPDGTTYTLGVGPGQLQPGDPRNGAQVDHTYTFSVPTAGTIEGFTIEYCATAFGYVGVGACDDELTDQGDFSAAAWGGGSVTIEGQTFTINANAVDNYLTFTSATGITVTAGQAITINMPATATDFFVNPNDVYRTLVDGSGANINGTYFAHISTYAADTDATGSFADADAINGLVDEGTVTNNVTQSISINTRVQETLNFSVEGDAANDGPTPVVTGCDPLTDSPLITMGDANNALASDQDYFAKSYFRLATNSSNGTVVYYSGNTLQSGGDLIEAIGNTPAASAVGTEQFGFTIDSSDGGNTLSGDADLGLEALVNYSDEDQYAFEVASATTPVGIAESNGIVDCETGAVEYVANIGVDTEAGIYTTKLNYIAAPSY